MEIVVSLKRSARSAAPEDWIEQILAVEGVETLQQPLFGRLVLKVTDKAMAELEMTWGHLLHIEPQTRYFPSDAGIKDD